MWSIVPVAEFLETEEQISAAGQYLYNSARENGLGVDTESTGLSITRDIPILVSLSDGNRRFAFYFDPWARHPWIQGALLENPEIAKIGSFMKVDMHWLANLGVSLRGPKIDTVVMDWLYDENRYGHGLKETAKDYLGLVMREFKEVFPMKKATKYAPRETPGEAIRKVLSTPEGRAQAFEYAGLDAYASHGVYKHLREKLIAWSMGNGSNLWQYFWDYEVPFTDVLWNMERRGITVCTGHLLAQMGPISKTLERLEAELAIMAGWPVNLRSPKQLQKLFFEQLGCKPLVWTPGGKSGVKSPSTAEETLKEWAGNADPVAGPFATLLLQHRGIAKIFDTYIEGMLPWVDNELRVHTTFKQTGTVTGRLSSAEPNLQNIPRPKTDRFKIREAFVASVGKILVVGDYDQLEMKLMAHFSGDEKMIDAINGGLDLHCFTAHLMYSNPYEELFAAKKAKNPTPEQELLLIMRQVAKTVGFALIYGAGANNIAQQLTEELKRYVPREEGQKLIRKYFDAFQGVERFIKSVHKYCQRTEYVQTHLGRFRRLPEINARGSGNDDGDGRGVAAQAKRQSVNSIIQGTASDIAKVAMLVAESDPELHQLGADMLLQIHDELVFEVEDQPEIIELTQKRVQDIMEGVFPGDFKVPLTADVKAAYTWASAK